MTASRDLPLLSLMIVCLVLIRGHAPLPTTSRAPGGNPARPLRPHASPPEAMKLPSDDYYEFYDTTTPAPPEPAAPDGGSRRRCDYDPCQDGQPPCAELAASTRCLCPGATLYSEPPEAPQLRSVSWNGSQVVLQWCAPYSHVRAYFATVGGEERRRFGKDQRSGAVGDIDHVAKVCLVAANEAGDSKEACMMYQPRDTSPALRAGLIGGALGLLLLVSLLSGLMWRRKRQRKMQGGVSTRGTAEAQ